MREGSGLIYITAAPVYRGLRAREGKERGGSQRLGEEGSLGWARELA
jgi:hypothetical protein